MSKLKLKKKRNSTKIQEDELGTEKDTKREHPEDKTDQVTTPEKKSTIVQRAIASAKRHNTKLEPGTPNSGGGNCAYLSVIYNINDRVCFKEKFLMSPDHYRRIWTIDLMNKILDKKIPWNPGMTSKEIQEGFQEIMESGIYERNFFGDMMIAGIACGVSKRILIFNTHENTIHDPISVIDPRDYGGEIDSKIPVVVAYNLVHYESLHPVSEEDTQETVKLVDSYSSGKYKEEYGFSSQSMPHLISTAKSSATETNYNQIQNPPQKKLKCFEKAQNIVPGANKKNDKNAEETEDFLFQNILFRETESGKTRCGVCEVECTRLIVHMNGNRYCTKYFSDMAEFKRKYSEFRDKRSRRRNASKRKLEDQEGMRTGDSTSQKNSRKLVLKEHQTENVGPEMNHLEPEPQTQEIETEDVDPQKEDVERHEEDMNQEMQKFGPQIQRKDSKEKETKTKLEVMDQEVNEKESKIMYGMFQFGGIRFDELETGKIVCGICQAECKRLICHLNKSAGCNRNLNMKNFKIEYDKYKARQRKSKQENKQKKENLEKFRDDAKERKAQHKAKKKAEDLIKFNEDARKSVAKHEAKKKAEDLNKFKDDAKKRVAQHKAKKKAEDLKKFNEDARKSKAEHEAKKKAEDLKKFKENAKERRAKSDRNITAKKRIQNFKKKVQFGPIFVCSCCHQKLFQNQVQELTDKLKEEIDQVHPEVRKKYIEEEITIDLGRDDGSICSYLCKSCTRSLKNGKMPKLCVENGLKIDEVDENLKLTDLENNLIARNIIFQKVHKLPKSRWSGTHDRLVNVPVQPQDVINTVKNLPRTPAEAGIIPIVPVSLKRKLEYKTSHLVQLIDTNKIFKYLDYLSKMGHPSYKFYDDWNTYRIRCTEEDPGGAKLVFPEPEEEIIDLEPYVNQLRDMEVKENICNKNDMEELELENLEIEEEEKREMEEEEYVKKDPIRKFQYDYNKTTCMTNKFPEANYDSSLSFAPAEGKVPTNILKDDDWDINSFPNLHPTGKNKMFQNRECKLTPQQYLTQRLKNRDTRFEQCTPYVFASAAYIEEKQMERNIGVSFRKGKINLSSEGTKSYKLDDAFAVLDDVKSTPKYWKKAKMEMLAKIDNFGPFHWFYTLSCADMRWDENFSSILLEKGYKIIWTQEKTDGEDDWQDVQVKVEFMKDGKMKQEFLRVFLQDECDESLHESIRSNVFIATRNFVQRVKAFRTEILMGKNNPDCIMYWSDKMEFQGRGAGHIHGVAWCDLKKVSEKIEEEREIGIILKQRKQNKNLSDTSHLENAYKKLRENITLLEDEENALIDFVDRSVTCTLNPELAAKMIDVANTKELGKKIVKIVKECLNHHHTKACNKHGHASVCRFRFPKFPVWQTILTKNLPDEDDTEKRNEKHENNMKLLQSVLQILENQEKVDEIMEKYDKENESIEEYRCNRKKRIYEVLELAKVDPEEYITALKESSRKGVNVILARDIDELYINNYDPEWVLAWDGNIDKQPCFDFFAVITYITEYFTKDESGTTALLAKASKNIKDLQIKDQKRCIKNVFLTHRQMGLSEAFMKIFPEMKLKDSNIGCMFIPLGKKEDISRYLQRVDPDLDYKDMELFEIEDREGQYYEKPNWIDKYLRRDMSEWRELSLPQHAKMFDPTNKDDEDDEKNSDNDYKVDEDVDASCEPDYIQIYANFEKDEAKYGEEVKFHYLITETGELGKPLPNVMKLNKSYPGEPKYLKKRRHPKALRFYKVKRDSNPARFFLHELMMYKSFDQEDFERWQDDEKCQEDYEKYKHIIKNVKSQVMEWIEDVEEARYFVEEVMKNDVDLEETGQGMDPELQKEDIECEIEGIEEDEAYQHLDPDGLKGLNCPEVGNWHRKLEMMDKDVLEQETRKLDKWQRKVVEIGLKYARGLKMFSNGSASLPKPRNLVVIGGAGSGKSTVIKCLTQWAHRTLVKGGDDPNSPYVLKAATTGAASTLIEGSTVHSSLGFDFSSKHTSLTDKKRELKKEQLKNLKILIIDEFSMMKADILYRIDMRLREITQVNQDFGGVNIFLFGDPAQLKPVRGSYIFAAPNCPDYKLAYGDGSESLWRSFDVINLEENHRQGKDKDYADMLNRMRIGEQTKKDLEILSSRVKPKGHKDLRGALFISAKVKPVSSFNKKAIDLLPGKLFVSKAVHIQVMSKNFKPKVDKESGRISDTQYVDELNLKIGARVMLIYNVDVSDLLNNGAIGTVIGIEQANNGNVSAVVVKFDNPEAGKESQRRNPGMALKYPNGTVIRKTEQDYSLSKTQGLISSTAKLIQIPLVLAWAVTVHKFQGQTVCHPQKVVIDLRSVFEAAQAYVMASRVQELSQLYILEELPKEKIYPSQAALEEIKRLLSASVNRNPTSWEAKDDSRTRISFLNCRSIKNKFEDVREDKCLLRGEVVILSETWLEYEDRNEEYLLPNYQAKFSNRGKGKGIASYYSNAYRHKISINGQGFSLVTLESQDSVIIGVYRSNDGNIKELLKEISMLIMEEKFVVIGGDLNINLMNSPNNYLTKELIKMGFAQIVKKSTHIEGGLIDHIYVRQGRNKKYSWIVEQFPKYYSDHDGLGLTFGIV